MKKTFIIFFVCLICTELLADNRWKNFYGIAWRDTPANHMKYAKSVGYDYIEISYWRTPAEYLTDSNAPNLKFYFADPLSLYGLFSEVSPYVRKIDENDIFTSYQKNWYETNMVWKGTSTFPQNLASGVMTSATDYNVMWDFQQQAVITKVITGIMAEATSFGSSTVPFTFGGVWFDEPKLMGGFYRWSGGIAVFTDLVYWLGTNSALLHGTITHQYSTYSDGLAEFYKQLRGSMTASFSNAKWLIEPAKIYNATAGMDEYVSVASGRADKNDLIPDLLLQEAIGVEFYNDSNIFNSGMAIVPNMVGSQQPSEYDEEWNRKYAVKAGIAGSWYHWSGRFGGTGNMPNFQAITEVSPRLKLIRLIPNWDNIILDGLSTATTRFEGSDFGTASYHSIDTSRSNRMNSHINRDAYWGRHPNNLNRIFAAFGTNSTMGTITLSNTETYENAWLINGYYEKAATATSDFVFDNSTKILSLAGTVSVDAGSWTGYIIETGTASVVNASMTYSGNTDDYAMTRSSVPDVFDGLVFGAPMNQGAGSMVRDVSTYGSNGTITGATWVNVDGRRCLSFDGIDDYVDYGNQSQHNFGTGSYSVVGWFNIQKFDGTADIFFGKREYQVAGYSFYVTSGNAIRAQLEKPGSNASYTFTSAVGTNTWFHLGLVVNNTSYPGGNVSTYLNSSPINNTSWGTWTSSNSYPLRIGRSPDGANYTNCLLDDARIYDKALSATEVSQIYNATK